MFLQRSNGYPNRVIHKALNDVTRKIEQEKALENNNNFVSQENVNIDVRTEVEQTPYFCLPYKGKEGEKVLKNYKDFVTKKVSTAIKPRFTFKGKKLGSLFKVKDKVNMEHQSNLIYGYNPYSGDTRKIEYVGETHVRLGARVHQHIVTDKKSHVYKYNQGRGVEANDDDFVILERGYQKTMDRKIAESLYVKQHEPALNAQQESFKLKLFN